MTKRKPYKEIERWLATEAHPGTDDGETAFGAALAALPRLEPRAGFAERVMYALQPEPARGLAWLQWGARAATIAVLALMGVAVGLLPMAGSSFDLPSAGSLLGAVTGGIMWTARWLSAGLEIWSILARIGNAIGVAMTTPQVGSALLATALVGAAALYELHRLLIPERRTA